MLTEPDVIKAVCQELESRGYVIEQALETKQHGDDIVALKSGPVSRRLIIEAKGETSSRQESNRYGKLFDGAQVSVHIAQALYRAADVLSRPNDEFDLWAGIALPDSKLHRRFVGRIKPVLAQLGIVLFWVRPDRSVQIDAEQNV